VEKPVIAGSRKATGAAAYEAATLQIRRRGSFWSARPSRLASAHARGPSISGTDPGGEPCSAHPKCAWLPGMAWQSACHMPAVPWLPSWPDCLCRTVMH